MSSRTAILRLIFPPDRSVLKNSPWTLSTSMTPAISMTPPSSRTPNTSQPPAVLANAETVSYADFGARLRASLNSMSDHSYFPRRLMSSLRFIANPARPATGPPALAVCVRNYSITMRTFASSIPFALSST